MRSIVIGFALAVVAASSSLDAQQWNDARAVSLARLATDRRTQQLTDSGLTDYSARAHGYLTFLAQLGEGLQEPPRVVKADELALEVYWRAPNLSKQHIVGRRDTTLLPTDLSYHRDHLGIIQNNFPAIIRLGDGDEVRDVPHPLSPAGLAEYEFALADSLRITIPGRVINVLELKVRPRDDRQPRVIGALYLDPVNGQVVRMALSFTRAAFLDRQLEDLFVVLENGLVGSHYWLPRRQEIEIRRGATWLDAPVRGIIRGRWEISDYQLNTGLPRTFFAGPEIVATPGAGRYAWPPTRILDSLPPDIRAVTADEVKRVQEEVRSLVREQALQRSRGAVLAGRGISDFARFNRVEGLALGGGLGARVGRGISLSARGRYGLADDRWKGTGSLVWQRANGARLAVTVMDDFRDAGDVAERSGALNSLAAQEWASDETDPYRVQGVSVGAWYQFAGATGQLLVGRERQSELAVHATPARGTFRATLPALRMDATRIALRMDQPTRLLPFGTEGRGHVELRHLLPGSGHTSRASTVVEIERPLGALRVRSQTIAAAAWASGAVPAQELVYLGGPVSVPGYSGHTLISDKGAAQRIELQFPIPFPAIGLGSFGRSAARATLSPHATVAMLNGSGPRRSAGVSLLFGFDVFRLDVSRGLDAGGRWIATLDVARAFWGIL
jgi:hypothetical protein